MSLATYLESHRQRHLDELFALLRIPSVSTDPALKGEVARAADFVADALRAAGFDVEVHATPGHPVVIARSAPVPDAPTVLIYGHYDVQPAEPLEEWTTPPFEPTVVDGDIRARGATDDKGQVFAHIKGAEAVRAVEGRLPLNVAFVVEGEEEIGSPNLRAVLERNAASLAADVVIVSDGAMLAPGVPTITYGLKGLAYLEVRVRTAGHDLHSGAYGGGVPNPVLVLCDMLAALKRDGRITVPGFYDDVVELTTDERERMAAAPFDASGFRDDTGVRSTDGEPGYSLVERLWARPTLDVNGIWGGFQGEGAKTVIPAVAGAKVSCRLVPDQEPEKIGRLLAEHLRSLAPAFAEVEVRVLHGGRPAVTSLDSPTVGLVAEALRDTFDREPVFARTGGTIPVIADFQDILGAEVVLVGMGLENDRAHAPNEKFRVDGYLDGIAMSANLLRSLAKLPA